MTDKERLEKVVATAISAMLKDIVRETVGEDTMKELQELSKLRSRIIECMDGCKKIDPADVERFNVLINKHFSKRGERDAEADVDQ